MIKIIETKKFKTTSINLYLSVPMTRDDCTKNALIPMILKRGSKNIPNQQKLSQKLDDMYGAYFGTDVLKMGYNQVLKFNISCLSNDIVPTGEDLVKKGIDLLNEIVFNPSIENEKFSDKYLKEEKDALKLIINSRIDNKISYTRERCYSELCKGTPAELYRLGYIEDLDKITSEELVKSYNKLIKDAKIDIIISGDVNANEIKKYIETIGLNIQEKSITNIENSVQISEPKIIDETMNIKQANICFGFDVENNSENDYAKTTIFSAVLGGGSNSKLFQNVREKAGLCYTTFSQYQKLTQKILVYAGIENNNYEKAKDLILKQVDDIKNSDFTDQDIEEAKNLIVSMLYGIKEEQDSEVANEYKKEYEGIKLSIEEFAEELQNVTREDIVEIANKLKLKVIYKLMPNV